MKKVLSAVAVVALMTGALVGCTSTESSSSMSQSSTTTSSQPNPVVTDYAVGINKGEGVDVTLVTSAKENGLYAAGSSVEFSVVLTNDLYEIVSVSVSDTNVVKLENNNYSFVMPNKDTTITVATNSIGDGSLLNVSDVKQEDVPTSYDALKERLAYASAVEGTYMKSATLDSTYDFDTDDITHYEVVAGKNNVLMMNGYTLSSDTSTISEHLSVQRGMYDEEHYYSVTTSSSYQSLSVEPEFKLVVADPTLQEGEEAPTLDDNHIYQSQASKLVSSYGLVDLLVEEFFTNDEFGDKYSYDEVKVSSQVNSDKKTYTTTVYGTYVGYSSYRIGEMLLTFDGDGFLNSAHYTRTEYDINDYDETLGELASDATPILDVYTNFDFVRGYKLHVEPVLDPTYYAPSNYDVRTYMKVDGVSEYLAVADGTVEAGSTLSFGFTVKDDNPWVNAPILVGGTEGFVEVNGQEARILKEGNFELYFDNGLGEIKTVALTSTPAQPHVISTSLTNGSTIFTEQETDLAVSILPAEASQDVTVVVDESSSIQANIVDKGNGVFGITPASVGDLSLLITSSANPELSVVLQLVASEKPDVEVVKEKLFTMSLKGDAYYSDHTITFEENGRGYYQVDSGDPISFTWTIDEVNLTIDTVFDNPSDTTGGFSPFTNLVIVDENNLFAVAHYFGSDYDMDLVFGDRVDFRVPESVSEITSILTSNTLNYSEYTDEYWVNFNSDNTGIMHVNEYGTDYYSTFTWSVDETTLEVTVTPDDDSARYNIEEVSFASISSVSLSISYNGGYAYSYDFELITRTTIEQPQA